MLPLAVQAAMAAIEKICPEAKNLLLIPEKHTRNTFYLMNLQRLLQIFHQAGLNVRLGTLDESDQGADAAGAARRQRAHARAAGAHAAAASGLKDFDPCTILLNNDLSAGIPPVLAGLHEQYLLPPLHAGWAVRRKTQPLPRLRGGGEEVRQAARHGPVADQPDVRPLRRGGLQRRHAAPTA